MTTPMPGTIFKVWRMDTRALPRSKYRGLYPSLCTQCQAPLCLESLATVCADHHMVQQLERLMITCSQARDCSRSRAPSGFAAGRDMLAWLPRLTLAQVVHAGQEQHMTLCMEVLRGTHTWG